MKNLSDFLTVSVSLGRAGVLALISVSAFSLWDSWLRLASRAFRSPSLRVLPAQTHNHLSQLLSGLQGEKKKHSSQYLLKNCTVIALLYRCL